MELDRRTFLQQAGLALFTLGATEAGISALANNQSLAALIKDRQQVAQPTSRKLALLVGINRYPHHDDLSGCLMDIELQQELLIHRFGFNASDILTLSDRQATRENIETAFVEHLVKQAQPDDVVVFHFSGYGSQIKMPLVSDLEPAAENKGDAFRLVNSFVPVDGLSSAKKTLYANNILQETLLLLAQSLSTSKCTFILDTCFNTTPRSKHGSYTVRSIPNTAENLSVQEQEFLAQLNDSFAAKGLKPSKRISSLPGVVLSATSNNQVAVERQWDGLSAGLFTQALTQHLWHLTPSSKVQIALNQTAETVEQVMGKQQQPSLNNRDKSAIAYYMAIDDHPQASAIVDKINQNLVEVKLLGLPIDILDVYGVGSCLNLVTFAPNSASPQLQIKSREGLISKVQPLSSTTELRVGQLLQESIRVLGRDLSLKLALDDDLERIERVDATSALASISKIDYAVVAKEQSADCLLGKVSSQAASGTSSPETEKSFGYGLYSAGGNLIGKTTGLAEEAVKIAIDRLQPQFNNLLAAKWLKLTSNEFSSQLKTSVSLIVEENKAAVSWQKATLLATNQQISNSKSSKSNSLLTSSSNNTNLPQLVKGTDIKLALDNLGESELYALVLGVDSDSNISALYTPAKSDNLAGEAHLENIKLSSQEELIIPSTKNSWKWKVPESTGINTLYIITATDPFEETLKAFATQQNFKLDQQQVLNVTNPVEVITALMEDLHNASGVSSEILPNENVYALNVKNWATLSFVYEVTNA